MISYGKQSIGQEDIDAVIEALKSDWLTQGPACEKFEDNLSNYFGSQYTCAVSNGTAALHLAGMALGWKPNDIIITSPITFLSTVNCIIFSGATPDFADIDEFSYTIDPNKLEERVKHHNAKGKIVKAVIGVDYAGHPCDWTALRLIADKYDLQLINDNCHALGAEYKGDKKYAVKFADLVTHSYHPSKHFTTGEGGAVLTNNIKIDDDIRTLRTHGMIKKTENLLKNEGPWYYEMHKVGFNYRITDIQCALGVSQLARLDYFVAKRKKIAREYDNRFSNLENVIVPQKKNAISHSYHLYPLQVLFKNLDISKSDFFNKMNKRGINLQVHYIPVHLQPYYMKNFGFKDGDYPCAEKFYQQEVSIPVYPNLATEQQSYVAETILDILEC